MNRIINNTFKQLEFAKEQEEKFEPTILRRWEDRTKAETICEEYILNNYRIEKDKKHVYLLVDFEGTVYAQRISNELLVDCDFTDERIRDIVVYFTTNLRDNMMRDVWDGKNWREKTTQKLCRNK